MSGQLALQVYDQQLHRYRIIQLVNTSGRSITENLSDSWEAVFAQPNNSGGFDILLKGVGSRAGQAVVWNADSTGKLLSDSGSGWFSGSELLRWEAISGLDLNGNGSGSIYSQSGGILYKLADANDYSAVHNNSPLLLYTYNDQTGTNDYLRLVNTSGRSITENLSDSWEAVFAQPNNSGGFDILLKGVGSRAGQAVVWNADSTGKLLSDSGSGWFSGSELLRWEAISGLDLNGNGSGSIYSQSGGILYKLADANDYSAVHNNSPLLLYTYNDQTGTNDYLRLVNTSGRSITENLSDSWEAVFAQPNNSGGFDILLKGVGSRAGQAVVWNADSTGKLLSDSGSGWFSGSELLRWEAISGLDLNGNGSGSIYSQSGGILYKLADANDYSAVHNNSPLLLYTYNDQTGTNDYLRLVNTSGRSITENLSDSWEAVFAQPNNSGGFDILLKGVGSRAGQAVVWNADSTGKLLSDSGSGWFSGSELLRWEAISGLDLNGNGSGSIYSQSGGILYKLADANDYSAVHNNSPLLLYTYNDQTGTNDYLRLVNTSGRSITENLSDSWEAVFAQPNNSGGFDILLKGVGSRAGQAVVWNADSTGKLLSDSGSGWFSGSELLRWEAISGLDLNGNGSGSIYSQSGGILYKLADANDYSAVHNNSPLLLYTYNDQTGTNDYLRLVNTSGRSITENLSDSWEAVFAQPNNSGGFDILLKGVGSRAGQAVVWNADSTGKLLSDSGSGWFSGSELLRWEAISGLDLNGNGSGSIYSQSGGILYKLADANDYSAVHNNSPLLLYTYNDQTGTNDYLRLVNTSGRSITENLSDSWEAVFAQPNNSGGFDILLKGVGSRAGQAVVWNADSTGKLLSDSGSGWFSGSELLRWEAISGLDLNGNGSGSIYSQSGGILYKLADANDYSAVHNNSPLLLYTYNDQTGTNDYLRLVNTSGRSITENLSDSWEAVFAQPNNSGGFDILLKGVGSRAGQAVVWNADSTGKLLSDSGSGWFSGSELLRWEAISGLDLNGNGSGSIYSQSGGILYKLADANDYSAVHNNSPLLLYTYNDQTGTNDYLRLVNTSGRSITENLSDSWEAVFAQPNNSGGFDILLKGVGSRAGQAVVWNADSTGKLLSDSGSGWFSGSELLRWEAISGLDLNGNGSGSIYSQSGGILYKLADANDYSAVHNNSPLLLYTYNDQTGTNDYLRLVNTSGRSITENLSDSWEAVFAQPNNSGGFDILLKGVGSRAGQAVVWNADSTGKLLSDSGSGWFSGSELLRWEAISGLDLNGDLAITTAIQLGGKLQLLGGRYHRDTANTDILTGNEFADSFAISPPSGNGASLHSINDANNDGLINLGDQLIFSSQSEVEPELDWIVNFESGKDKILMSGISRNAIGENLYSETFHSQQNPYFLGFIRGSYSQRGTFTVDNEGLDALVLKQQYVDGGIHSLIGHKDAFVGISSYSPLQASDILGEI